MKMTDSYVIGLSPSNLLDIQLCFDFDSEKTVVNKIVHGMMHIDEATIIGGEEYAHELLQEIRERYNDIMVFAPNILESVHDGNDIDPMKLHIYEVNVGKEIM